MLHWRWAGIHRASTFMMNKQITQLYTFLWAVQSPEQKGLTCTCMYSSFVDAVSKYCTGAVIAAQVARAGSAQQVEDNHAHLLAHPCMPCCPLFLRSDTRQCYCGWSELCCMAATSAPLLIVCADVDVSYACSSACALASGLQLDVQWRALLSTALFTAPFGLLRTNTRASCLYHLTCLAEASCTVTL